jgi:hypothetical protein
VIQSFSNDDDTTAIIVMGKKGKGRQSLGFGSKGLRAAHAMEIQQQVGQIHLNRPKQSQQQQQQQQLPLSNRPRPRLATLTILREALRERSSQELYELQQHRRRAGFLPPSRNEEELRKSAAAATAATIQRRHYHHPPGWLVHYADADANWHLGDEIRASPMHRRRRRLRRERRQQQQHAASLLPIFDDKEEEEGGEVEPEEEWKDDSSSSATKTVLGMSSLQSKCIGVLGKFLPDYLNAMGREDLNAALSLLPGDSLTTLSIMVSRSHGGITNDLCYVLGASHGDLDRLSLRAAPQSRTSSSSSSDTTDTLTDEGLLSLIPTLASNGKATSNQDDDGGGGKGSSATPTAYDSWEDYLSEEENNLDHSPLSPSLNSMLQLGESYYSLLRLRRLELIDCQFVSAGAVRKLLQRCSGMTHLSVRGSIFLRTPILLEEENDANDDQTNNKDAGSDSRSDSAEGKGDPSISLSSFYGPEQLLLELPDLLPALQVLDLSHCAWVTTSLLEAFGRVYADQQRQHEQEEEEDPWSSNAPSRSVPLVYCVGGMHQNW